MVSRFVVTEVILKDSKLSQESSTQPEQVKPGGSGKRVDLPLSTQNFESPVFETNTMEEVCAESNLELALRKVEKNKGAAGVDGIATHELRCFLNDNWQIIKSQLLMGKYTPNPILRVEIPKPGSDKKRKLGIPCCVDRLIQQMLLQVLQPCFDPYFSDSSFGFRPRKSCAMAVKHAQAHLKAGYEICVDIDLDSFFDRINHDRLMSKLMKHIKDKRVLKLIRSFLTSGILIGSEIEFQSQGSAQGGPLSPFLSNIVLDELDKELENRGLRFARYADDLQIFVKSERAGIRVLENISKFIESKLKLKVNQSKSAVDRPQNRKFLGFTFSGGTRYSNRVKVHPDSIKRFKSNVRKLTRRNSGKSLEDVIKKLNLYLKGWSAYYSLSESMHLMRELDAWIRHRLRSYQWKAWKTYRNRKQMLLKLGVRYDLAQTTAFTSKSYWRISNTPGVRIALNNSYFDSIGLHRLVSRY